MKKLLLLTFFTILVLEPVFGFSSSTEFYAVKSANSPKGAGYIYIYHAKRNSDMSQPENKPDRLTAMSAEMWLSPDSKQSSGDITMGDQDSDYHGDGYITYNSSSSSNTHAALNMYFYAKPKAGYRFLGWKSTDDNTLSGFAEGSDKIYTTDKTKAGQYTIWNNGLAPDELPKTKPAGYYADYDYYYLRHVDEVYQGNTDDRYFYAYFQVIPQLFTFGGTGNAELTYTAQAGSDYTANVGVSDVAKTATTDSTSNDITLTLGSYDTDLYKFVGWYYDYRDANNTLHSNNLLSASTTATYSFNGDNEYEAAARKNVKIYPRIDDVSDKAALVDFDGSKEFFDTWAEAFADALTKSASREDKAAPTIKLLADATGLTTTQTVNQPMTINLNGHTINGTGSAGVLFSIEGSGTEVTIADVKPGQIVMNDDATQYTYAISVKSGASLTITGGTISNTNTKDNGSARAIEVHGSLTVNGGTISATSNQNAYAVINRNSTTISDGTLSATTTTAATAVCLLNTTSDGATATINGGTLTANSATSTANAIQCGTGTVELNNAILEASGTSTAYCANRTGGSLTINGGYFQTASTAPLNGTIVLRGGKFKVENTVRAKVASGYGCYEVETGADYTLGYRYEVTPTQAHPHTFKAVQQSGTTYYETLQDALAYAANEPVAIEIIQMVPEYTLPAGNYTIPSYASLIIPKNIDQSGAANSVQRVATYTKPSLFKKLILADGVRLDVFGTLEAAGTQNSQGQGANGAGVPSGPYGQIELQAGSRIILNNGSRLNAWGFVTGSGEIDARRGSTVFEQFQMYDWKGGWGSKDMLGNSKKVFPVTQYFIQNVEAPVTYHPGSSLTSMTSVNVSDAIVACDIVKVIGVYGDIAMFLMDDMDDSEDTWVRKEYDATNDKQVYKVNSSAQLGSMQLTMEGVPVIGTLDFNSQNYILPLTNNMKIELLTGSMEVTQNTLMLPGAELEVDKEATVSVLDEANVSYDGQLYLMDADQWEQGHVYSNAYVQQVRYSPSFNGAPNKRGHMDGTTFVLDKPDDATLFVHGTFDVQGALYTTEGGANIYSTKEDAGTIAISKNAPTGSGSVSVFKTMTGSSSSTEVSYQDYSTTSAKLKNEVGDPTFTAGTEAGNSFCYLDFDGTGARWTMLVTDECFVYDAASGKYYAKPADYVELQNGKTENADHTYSSADGTRLFILLTGCQWWEVVYDEVSGLYYCDKNGIYYYYDDSDPRPEYQEWLPKTYTITWQNWDGLEIETYSNIVYGSTPNYLGSTPKRTKDDYYTYDFIGWAPALSPVTEDVTYIAQFERKDRMYTITWKDELNNTIETDYCKMGQIPVCYNEPDMTGKEWSPAVSAVTGDQTYTLQTKVVKANYTINWNNWDGSLLQSTTPAAGTAAADVLAGYTAGTPTKAALSDIAFEFAGWSPTVVDANADAVYTATFTEQPITYTILWKNYDDATLETDENVAPNAVPQYNGATPTKPSDEDNNYIFDAWTPEVVAATEDAIYTATFTAIPKDKIVDGETYDVPASTQQTVTNLIIKDDGIVNIPSTSRINADNLIIEATSNESGQLIATSATSINPVNAYFDWTMNGADGTQYRTWYAIAVPWEVNAEEGIFIKDGRHLVLGRDFDLVWYDGEERAANGDGFDCWKYVEYETDKIMHPGRLYMMYFGPTGIQTVRFAKKSGAAVIYNSPVSVETYAVGTGDNKDGNWNGIANPRTYYASLGTGASYAQVLNNGSLDDYQVNHPENNPVYKTINLASSTFNVGKPFFVQAVNPQSVIVNKAASANIVYSAPKRDRANNMPEGIDAVFAVTIGTETNHAADNLFIQATEDEKEATYVIGQDLAKGGVAKTIPQLWVNRYNAKLSVNTQALVNGVAEYPLTLFAPQADEYTIHSTPYTSDSDYDLYLTLNGEAIWNLSDGAYTFTLPQGNTAEYGLRIRAKAPEVATGIEEAIVDAQGDTRKVMLDQKVYIIRGNKMYSVDGQMVK